MSTLAEGARPLHWRRWLPTPAGRPLVALARTLRNPRDRRSHDDGQASRGGPAATAWKAGIDGRRTHLAEGFERIPTTSLGACADRRDRLIGWIRRGRGSSGVGGAPESSAGVVNLRHACSRDGGTPHGFHRSRVPMTRTRSRTRTRTPTRSRTRTRTRSRSRTRPRSRTRTHSRTRTRPTTFRQLARNALTRGRTGGRRRSS